MAPPVNPPSPPSPTGSALEGQGGFWIVIAGLILLGITVGVAVSHWTAAADVTAVITTVGTIVGTIIGTFFGVEAGGKGRKDAQNNADQTQRLLGQSLDQLRRMDRALLEVTPLVPASDQGKVKDILNRAGF